MRIKRDDEVFTPDYLVKEILSNLPDKVWEKGQTFLDNSCGNGQFLFAVMKRKMKYLCKGGMTGEKAHKQALSTIYGVEIDEKNAEECRVRLLCRRTNPELRAIVDHNIICADALDPNHPGWADVGFYWDETMKPKPFLNRVDDYIKKIGII